MWEPGVDYSLGVVVSYQGSDYRILQPHRSQTDWIPPNTAALWERISDHNNQSVGGYKHEGDMPEVGQTGQTPQLLFNSRVKEEGESDEVLKKGRATWIQDAKARTERFNAHGPEAPATWVLTQKKEIPSGALQVDVGHPHGMLYLCRSYHDGGLQLDKISRTSLDGAVIDTEQSVAIYEILVGDMRGLRWVPTEGRMKPSCFEYQLVEGGRERNGTPFYIGRAVLDGVLYLGKANETQEGASTLQVEGGVTEHFEVLCYYR